MKNAKRWRLHTLHGKRCVLCSCCVTPYDCDWRDLGMILLHHKRKCVVMVNVK